MDFYDADIYPTKWEIAGWTLPINTMLYYGASGSTLHSYQWQSDSTGDNIIQVDPHKACKQVTIDACSKLKTDFSGNIRVYVIKYRKQDQYRISQQINNFSSSRYGAIDKDFDYSYIDDCASSAEYVYDVNSKTALESTLDDIADDIKEWADYEEAHNISYEEPMVVGPGFW